MAARRSEPPTTSAARRPPPTPLTSFIGRVSERAALGDAVRTHRLVTATGPGGVGKTRLALAAAGDVNDRFADGVIFVDLVQVTEPAAVVLALADAAGVAERVGATRREALLAALGELELLVVLDNCEHLADAARRVIADLLARCPGVSVLATSRLRLLLPGEHVLAVPGMSLDGTAPGESDAETLFVTRAGAAGADAATLADREAIRDVCRSLDGMALAIEIGAARVPSLGVDGLRRALAASFDVLELSHGPDDRHGSVRAAIEWSYRLLDVHEQHVLRACGVFGAPFDVDAAAAVLDEPPVRLMTTLGRLVDWSLVTLRPGSPTRYRMLETVRQHVADKATALGELDELRLRHARWCDGMLGRLADDPDKGDRWVQAVDAVADDVRGAVTWLTTVARNDEAAVLAARLGDVIFLRGRPGEAQQRFEQAADVTLSDEDRHDFLVQASRAALTRYVGLQAVELLERAAEVAADGGRSEAAACDLANAVTLYHRHVGTVDGLRTDPEIQRALDRAASLAGDVPLVRASIAVAAAWRSYGAGEPESRALADHAVVAARPTGDALLLDAALDGRCAAELIADDIPAAVSTLRERLLLMDAVPIDVRSGMDHADVRLMGVHVHLASGDYPTARRWAEALATLPFLREEQHVALARRIEADAAAGRFADAIEAAERFADGWRRSGRPRVNSHGPATYAASMVHGILGDDERRAEWIDITRSIMVDFEGVDRLWRRCCDATLHLHRGDVGAALERCAVAPDEDGMTAGLNQIWRSLYAATWAEASTLAGVADATDRLERAAYVARHHPVATAMIERAAAWHEGRYGDLAGIAERLAVLGCPYQQDRTLRLAADRVGNATAHAGAAPFELTSREIEVLALVEAGRTNPQIASALFISRKTAEHHVSRILTKLGVTTRAEAAGLAARLQLTRDGRAQTGR